VVGRAVLSENSIRVKAGQGGGEACAMTAGGAVTDKEARIGPSANLFQ
jgi:hypothetical protein